MLVWLFIVILMIAVLILIVLQFRKEQNLLQDESQHHKLEEKVVMLESNLKKTLEIMQDLAKSVQLDRELLNQTVQKSKLLELQNAELIALITKYVGHAEDFKRINEFEQDDLK
ncbi:hypothetical protein D7V21_01900 [Acinetobacter guerrae]|uniref:Uncharacterized protein n=1 Tax=Acinetobacter guerrae TaxID=1843371 RepID=A0A3A8END1_9GAMM|nr:hypothetical protein [Acinetobacter guerrae]RKG35649.1 hypothetical protein D7V21_01900 [Acinetobacter guerrae]